MSIVSNVHVYGLKESVKAKYPMAVNTERCTDAITEKTRALAKAPIGSGHDNWLNGVVVQFDLTFTVKAWTEAERYHFLDFVSSQSTMHRLTKFELDKVYVEYVDPRIITVMKYLKEQYNADPSRENYLRLIYSNPVGCKLTARMTTNYRQLKTIYSQRKNHRLPEWIEFCDWVKTLPHSEWITCEEEDY